MAAKKPKPGEQDLSEIPATGVAATATPAIDRTAKVAAETAAKTAVEENDRQDPRKPAVRILEQQITAGLDEIERSTSGLLISGLAGGLELGFSVFLMAAMITMDQGQLPAPLMSLLVAGAYAVGFVLVIIGRSLLFTEQTALAMLPVLHGRANIAQLLRTWSLIYVANIVGGALFALMAAVIGPSLGIIEPEAFNKLAARVVDFPWWTLLLSAVLAGWLMALLSWLVFAARDTTAQVLLILIVTGTISLGYLPHVIASSIEVFVAMFSNQGVGLNDLLYVMLWTTIGNSIGGVIFVAAIKYNDAVRSPKPQVKAKIK